MNRKETIMRVAVYGAGGIGAYFVGRLAHERKNTIETLQPPGE